MRRRKYIIWWYSEQGTLEGKECSVNKRGIPEYQLLIAVLDIW